MSIPAITIDSLSIRFGQHEALRDISLRIAPGDVVAVLGPNGSGKSTLLRTLLGLQAATSGEVQIFGQAPGAEPASVGYVPQVKSLDRSFPALGRELVETALGHRWPWRRTPHAPRVEAALARVGAEALADRPLSVLSGGELQRIYLARGLIRHPRLLILDEPATGIDVRGQTDLYELLDRYHAETGATIVMVTHDWDAARHHASHVLLLNGTQVGFGPSAETLSAENLRIAFGHVGHQHAMTDAGGAPQRSHDAGRHG